MSTTIKDQICPECGEFFDKLILRTGWCRQCTNEIDVNSPVCLTCNRVKSPNEPCLYCRLERWYERNADHVEHYILQGQSLNRSIELVRAEVVPRCASCGGLMKYARRDVVFCRKHPLCRRAVRRYSYLTQDLGMNKPLALSQVLEELNT